MRSSLARLSGWLVAGAIGFAAALPAFSAPCECSGTATVSGHRVVTVRPAVMDGRKASSGTVHAVAYADSAKDIVDTAVAAGCFTTLAKALQPAGVIETLKGAGPFTVFAQTDEAFAKLPAGTLEALLKDKAKLTAILTYHVVPGRVMAADVGGLDSAKTLQGQSLTIDTSNGVRIGGAGLVTADVVASNGVIHIIDTVLIPN